MVSWYNITERYLPTNSSIRMKEDSSSRAIVITGIHRAIITRVDAA
jgi:hypothetical protein